MIETQEKVNKEDTRTTPEFEQVNVYQSNQLTGFYMRPTLTFNGLTMD